MSRPWRWLGWLCLAPLCAFAVEPPAPDPSPTPRLPRLRERLRQPLGSPRAIGRPGDTKLLRFEETVTVTVPPLDLERLRVEWTRHWNLSGRERAEAGPPGHSEMREQSRRLSELYGAVSSSSASLPILGVLAAAGQAIAKGVKRERMPAADPRPAPQERPAPLEVDMTEDAQPTPTPAPDSDPPEIVRRPNE